MAGEEATRNGPVTKAAEAQIEDATKEDQDQ